MRGGQRNPNAPTRIVHGQENHRPLVGRILKSELKVEVAPELGLYLLAAALAAVLAASFLPAGKR
ncbi:MAG: hypothetical protein ACRD4T_13730 [Candidatus Acidiferrales bacterium]